MAPEIMRGVAYDRKVDVYSYAMMLVMLITRRDPYPLTRWNSPQSFIKDITTGVRPDLPAETPPKLVHLLRRCWDADSTLRPSFNEIAAELTPILVETGTYTGCKRSFQSIFSTLFDLF
jgi:serine/threonine protein kinase